MYSRYIGFCLYLSRRCLKSRDPRTGRNLRAILPYHLEPKNKLIPCLNMLNTFSKRPMVMQWNNTKIQQKEEEVKNKVLKKSLTKQPGRRLRGSTKRWAINGWGKNNQYPLWINQNLIIVLQPPLRYVLEDDFLQSKFIRAFCHLQLVEMCRMWLYSWRLQREYITTWMCKVLTWGVLLLVNCEIWQLSILDYLAKNVNSK